jgi:hypothetical protein
MKDDYLRKGMKFVDERDAKLKIRNGTYLTSLLRDNLDNRSTLCKFYTQVMINKNRQACYVRKGGMIALYVDRVR